MQIGKYYCHHCKSKSLCIPTLTYHYKVSLLRAPCTKTHAHKDTPPGLSPVIALLARVQSSVWVWRLYVLVLILPKRSCDSEGCLNQKGEFFVDFIKANLVSICCESEVSKLQPKVDHFQMSFCKTSENCTVCFAYRSSNSRSWLDYFLWHSLSWRLGKENV